MELTNIPIKTGILNNRREIHGDEKVFGVSLKCTAQVQTTVLDSILTGMAQKFQDIFYDKEGMRRCPEITKLALDAQFSDHEVKLEPGPSTQIGLFGPSKNEDIELTDVEIKVESAEPLKTGLVELVFTLLLKPTQTERYELIDGAVNEHWVLTLNEMDMTGIEDTDGEEPAEETQAA